MTHLIHNLFYKDNETKRIKLIIAARFTVGLNLAYRCTSQHPTTGAER